MIFFRFAENNKKMTAIIDKKILKEALRELFIEEPNYMGKLLSEVNAEQKSKKQRLLEIVKEDFEEYDSVFKALA